MRLACVGSTMALVACSGGGGDPDAAPVARPALTIDVAVTDWVEVAAVETAAPYACTPARFIPPGSCVELVDVVQCPAPQDLAWVTEARLVAADGELGRAEFHAPNGAGFAATLAAGHADVALELRTVDGVVARIAIPAVAPPVPSVTAATWDRARVDVTWSATPAAATVDLAVDHGLGGQRCHVDAAAPLSITWPWAGSLAPTHYLLTAYAAGVTTATPLGPATVRVGRAVDGPVVAPAVSGFAPRGEAREARPGP